MAKITVNGITIDPVAQGPALAAANLRSADATDSNYILIQTDQPLDKDMKSELKDKGVVILEYVPDDTYLCGYAGTDLDQLRSLSYVVWANTYMQGFKVAPSLRAGAVAAGTRLASPTELSAESTRTLDTTPKTVDVVFHSDIDPESIRSKLASAVQLDPSDLRLTRHKIRVSIAANQLIDLARIDEIRHVEEVFPMKLHNDVARRILNVEPPPNPGRVFEGGPNRGCLRYGIRYRVGDERA